MKVKLLFILASVALLSACGGGNGSGYDGTDAFGDPVHYSHEDLAKAFVHDLNKYPGYNVQLVKTNTQQYNYIVVYNVNNHTYDAYSLVEYDPTGNISWYLSDPFADIRRNLDVVGDGTYRDPVYGTIFQKDVPTTKNLSKMKALAQALEINDVADNLRVNYGMSAEKSLDTARFVYKIQHSAPGTYIAKDYDAFTKELIGSSISEIQTDLKKHDTSSLNSRLQTMTDLTGMTPEGVNQLMKDVFSAQ